MDAPPPARGRASAPAAPLADLTGSERELFVRSRSGDALAREELILRYVPLARRLAQRYRRCGEPADDLAQVASVGLIKAIDGYDVDRGGAFVTYATPTILGELKHHFRDLTWAVRVPHGLSSLAVAVDRHRVALQERLRREPSVAELAAESGVSDVEVLDALLARGAYRALSFDAPGVTSRGSAAVTTPLADAVGADDDGYAHAERRATLARLLPALDGDERDVITMRFAGDMTQTQIAKTLGVSPMQISRLIRHAIEHLRAAHDTAREGASAHAA
jgi:RNA polymerase sigma-B factor